MKPPNLSKGIQESLRIFRSTKSPDNRPPAQAPGSLVHVGEKRVDEVSFRIIDFSETEFVERSSASLEECLELDKAETPTWIQVNGLHDTDAVGRLLDHYGIHPLVQEDVLNTNHRLKLENFESYIFVAVKEISEAQGIFEARHLSLILGERTLITFQEGPTDLFAPIEERLRSGKGQLRKSGADYLLWAVLDAVTDHYRIAVDRLADQVAGIELEIEKEKELLSSDGLFLLKRDADMLFRTVRPLREIATALRRMGPPLCSEQTTVFWSDLQDHTYHVSESAEIFRETVTSLREFHLSKLSQRMNEAIRFLTAFASIFLPLTFIAGVYGMNFEFMPELAWEWAYPSLWVIFLIIAAIMSLLFRKKKWI